MAGPDPPFLSPAQVELDLFMHAFEKALNEVNTPGPYNTALALQAARKAVEYSRTEKETATPLKGAEHGTLETSSRPLPSN